MKETIYNRVKVVPCVNTAAITTVTTTSGTAIDLDQTGQDFRSVSVLVVAGAITDGSYAVAVQESANGTTGWTNIPPERLLGSIPTITNVDDNKVYELGVLPDPGNAQFLRVTITSSGAITTGGTFTALLLLGQGNRTPVNRP